MRAGCFPIIIYAKLLFFYQIKNKKLPKYDKITV